MTILLNMGSLMSEPVTEKVSADESGESVKYGVSSMQGWRVTQEDAHACMVDFDGNTSLFAVFDGHGGCEVAKYCAQNLPQVLKRSKPYGEGDVVNALIETFLQVDASLTTPEVELKLKEIVEKDSDSDVESVGGLQEEAEMPLEELMAKYKIKPVVNGKVEDQKDCNGTVDSNGIVHTNGFTKSEVDSKESVDVEMADDSEFKTPKLPISKSKEKSNASLYKSLLEQSYSEDEADKSYIVDGDDDDDDDDDEEEEEEEEDEEPAAKQMREGESGEVEHEEEGVEDEEDDGDWEDIDDEDDDGEHQPGFSSGTTAIVALLKGRELFVANVGDSRCVVSQNGVAVEMSRDHKPTVPEEVDRISKAGGSREMAMDGRVEGDLSLSRAIGDHRYKQNKELPPEQQMITAQPEVKSLTIDSEHDFMILACDGIWECLSSQEVVDFVRPRIMEMRDQKLSLICEELLDRCLAPKRATGESGWDNMTAIIVKFGPGLVTVGQKSAKCGTTVQEEKMEQQL